MSQCDYLPGLGIRTTHCQFCLFLQAQAKASRCAYSFYYLHFPFPSPLCLPSIPPAVIVFYLYFLAVRLFSRIPAPLALSSIFPSIPSLLPLSSSPFLQSPRATLSSLDSVEANAYPAQSSELLPPSLPSQPKSGLTACVILFLTLYIYIYPPNLLRLTCFRPCVLEAALADRCKIPRHLLNRLSFQYLWARCRSLCHSCPSVFKSFFHLLPCLFLQPTCLE